MALRLKKPFRLREVGKASQDRKNFTINLNTETGLLMRITVKVDTENRYVNLVELYDSNKLVDFAGLKHESVLYLINKYYALIYELRVGQENEIGFPFSMLRGVRGLIDIVKKGRKIFASAHAITVDTEDGFRDIVFARTRVELDGDIITMMTPDVLKTKGIYILMSLHQLNVSLANEFIRSTIHEYFLSIKNLINMIRIISSGIWVSLNAYAFWAHFEEALRNSDWHVIAFFLLDIVGGPYLLIKYLPKLFGYILGYKIRGELSKLMPKDFLTSEEARGGLR
jgi:hypothetical protein